MGSHALSGPDGLADPTPFGATAGPRTHHMHTAAVALRRRPALWTRLRHYLDGNFGSFLPSRLYCTAGINCILATVHSFSGRRIGQTFSNVVALEAISAEDVTTSSLASDSLAKLIN